MARKSPGLHKRGQFWWMDKSIKGYGRVRESTGTSDLSEAEHYLVHRVSEIRLQTIYGVRPTRTFAEAATKYIKEQQHLRSLERSAYAIKALLPCIGSLPLDKIHNDTLAQYKLDRLAAGMSPATVNKEISVLVCILRLAARRWRDENGTSWLATAPEIVRVPGEKKRKRPISWDEQDKLFKELPDYLAQMALFAVNTGLRQQEVCSLRWDWEFPVPELDTSVFIIPGAHHKNGEDRLVVLNQIAKSIIEARCGKHPEWVFANTKTQKPYYRMTNSAWVTARKRARLQDVRVHDLRHTFGHRLRSTGVSFEDRQDLLGHKSNRTTTDYSAPDLERLIEAANRLCKRKPTTILRVVTQSRHNLRHDRTVVGEPEASG